MIPAFSVLHSKNAEKTSDIMSKAPPTICILGCGGFIGSHLVERILSRTNWHVCGVDRNSSKITACCNDPKFTFAKVDVGSSRIVDEFIGKSDIVVSLVALCNPSLYNTIPLEVIKSNFTQPMEIVEKCSRLKKWLIHFSTCEVYGTSVSHAARREFDPDTDTFGEDATPLVLGPVRAQRWTYACAKQLLERAIFAYGFEYGLDYTIVRPFNFIGPRMDFIPGIDGEGVPRVLACFMDALLSGRPLKLVDGGKNYRSFTFIGDAIDALMAVLERPKQAKGRIFNIGNPHNETTIAGLAKMMIRIYNELRPECAVSPAPQVETVPSAEFYGEGYEDSDRRIPDISKAQSLLGWEPATSLATALKTTIAYYIREYGSTHTDTDTSVYREAI
jgi:UDP-apiose/xylose synthase